MKKTAEEDFKEKQALMSDSELIELAKAQVSELAKTGGRSHRMCVPPSIKDTDMLFSELIRRFEFSSQDKWVSVETPPKKLDEFELQREATKRSDYLQKKSGWRGFIEGASWMQDLLFPSPPKTK